MRSSGCADLSSRMPSVAPAPYSSTPSSNPIPNRRWAPHIGWCSVLTEKTEACQGRVAKHNATNTTHGPPTCGSCHSRY